MKMIMMICNTWALVFWLPCFLRVVVVVVVAVVVVVVPSSMT